MHDDEGSKEWQEAQDRLLLEEHRLATVEAAKSMQDAEKWFLGLPLAERDRIGRRMKDPRVIARHFQTPRTH
jgi:hypothetical protein